MRKGHTVLAATVLLADLFIAQAHGAAATISLKDVPAAVQTAIQARLGEGKLQEIEKEEEDGAVTFTATMTKAETERDFSLDSEGRLLSEELGLEQTPTAVQKTIKAQLGTSRLDRIDRLFEEAGHPRYEVELTTSKEAERSFIVGQDGRLLSLEVDLQETPPPVRATIQAQVGRDKIEAIYRQFEDGEISYEVEYIREGKARDLSVAPDGKLLHVQMFLSELPPVVQKAIQEKLANGKLLRIDKAFEPNKGVLPFEIEARKDGKPFNFSIGPKGRFLGMDE